MKAIGFVEHICSVCGKKFITSNADNHVWRDKKGRCVCSYTCDRKANETTGAKRWFVEGKRNEVR